VADCNNP
jgi:hypothetical protein